MPNFFIIGFPKCGTTALSEYLREHPQVFFSDPKEPFYFSTDWVRSIQSEKEYARLFEGSEKYRAVGEGSTGYIYSRVAVPEILKHNPQAKFIVMVRNPLEMVLSLHGELLFEGIEDVKDFETAWRLQAERKQGACIPQKCKEPRELQYGEMCKQGKYLERFFSLVPRKQTLVIVFDDFVTDTRKVYETVLRFLECEPDNREYFPRVNERKERQRGVIYRIPRLSIFSNRTVRRASFFLKRMLGIKSWPFLSWLHRKSVVRAPRPEPLRPEFKRELCEYFREDVEKLSRLLERDLTHWT